MTSDVSKIDCCDQDERALAGHNPLVTAETSKGTVILISARSAD
jgi:hypothetical protein